AHNNGAWGLQTAISMNAQTINSYLNTSGGCDIQANGALVATNAFCDTTTGWGLLAEAASGQIEIASGNISGGIPLELRSGGGGTILAGIANPSGANPCIKINGGGFFVINTVFLNCATT